MGLRANDILNIPADSVLFTVRERQILESFCRGYGNKQIAYRLKIRKATVQNHINGLLHKLQSVIKESRPDDRVPCDRHDLMVWAMQHPDAVKTGFTRYPWFHEEGCTCENQCAILKRMNWLDAA